MLNATMNSMKLMKGYTLVEVMVSMVVMAVGLLAVANFQSELIGSSANSKAHAEALALAQERIEQFRSETTETNYMDQMVLGTTVEADPIQGVNATFNRQWQITQTGNTYSIIVTVSWNDRVGNTESVSLSTLMMFDDPSLAAKAAEQSDAPLVPSATGRARLGEGVYDGEGAVANDDGMRIDINDDEKQLIDGDDNVVLTLEEACQIDNAGNTICTDFVKISGIMYFDTANLNNSYDMNAVHVIASDAAYCNRYVIDANNHSQFVDSNTTLMETPNGDYAYYHYTCYLGGGWHGNIGVVMNNPSQRDVACVGDPGIEIGQAGGPELAVRRSYRGMIYEKDAQGDPLVDQDTGIVVYHSIGIKDATNLPASGNSGHNFVVTDLGASATAVDCLQANQAPGPMTRADSYYTAPQDGNLTATKGMLFAGLPGDFVCLNPDNIDNYDNIRFGHQNICPYDPTDPPAAVHTITATVTVNYLTDPAKLDNFQIKTSDTLWEEESTCIPSSTVDVENQDSSITRTMTFACDVYDWYDEDEVLLGWTGEIGVRSNHAEIGCSPTAVSFSALTVDSTAAFTCVDGLESTMSGTVEAVKGNAVIQTAEINGIDINVQQVTAPSCTLGTDGKLSTFSCSTGKYRSADQLWDGMITLTLNNADNLCQLTTENWWFIESLNGSYIIRINDLPAATELDFTNKLHITNGACPAI